VSARQPQNLLAAEWRALQWVGQLGDVDRDAPGLVAGEQVRR
jgi:hypothetical protein